MIARGRIRTVASRWVPGVVLVLASALLAPPAMGAEVVSGEVVRAEEPSAQPSQSMETCEGIAPYNVLAPGVPGPEDSDAHCVRRFVAKRDFTFVISTAVGDPFQPTTFVGAIWLHYFTPTARKTVVCWWYAPECDVVHDATFNEGDTLTLAVAVTGKGYWRVRLQ